MKPKTNRAPASYPFTQPPPLRDVAEYFGQSYESLRRMVRAGVVPIVNTTRGDKVETGWANRYIERGMTADEKRRYHEYWKEKRRP